MVYTPTSCHIICNSWECEKQQQQHIVINNIHTSHSTASP